MTTADVIIIGGGAAGLMCAITAGNRGRRVIVLEGSNKIGKKILMSGGGRCNFTNLHCEPSRFVSDNPQFCISALTRYTQWDFIALVEKHGIPYHEKTAGQLFCDNSSKDIVSMLQKECDSAGVQILTHCAITSVVFEDRFTVSSNKGKFASESLVVASGGLSIPKMGASGFGYQLARQFGHKVLDTTAGLVPFTFTGAMHDLTGRLSGVSTAATVSTGEVAFTDDILFTHRGLSGPAILQLSSYWSPGDDVDIDLMPGTNAVDYLLGAKQTQPKALLRTALGALLPRALVTELQALLWPDVAETPLTEIADDTLHRIAGNLGHWTLKPAATEGYRTAEVTLGGVDTAELSSRTLESRRQPGLYFVGEVVDVTGHLGGFNFQWAWSSGWAAGQVA
ncbi:MAG: NAD(P)/FAD-dependent oxidoreductase [Gammaproteobacteria bacterium]|nr:NAD(P)/FAD-dependent oxidoreductase [Gammaproteobacteria bacterium]MBT8110434.1 NAD(P)/FAD-dependent oxidoreductase [Gammaproteobacteria bacterium]NND46558.1 NAD(P)/FAD-dependent oxidoreductase [Woeseiaceae bacterium]NNL45134.1 NAD(P)/FAD-dependent oxidoreductase [Woeseiaceae bacterium]